PSATAGYHGGALLAGTVLTAGGRPFGRTPGFADPDPVAGVIPYDGRTLAVPNRVLLTATAPGGSAGWALLGSVEA
ncbi:MAG: hypothetical protein K8R59_04485, partial [Thermoanaerobaculales bacterium]|nr:hypothetical protein [Thermoanaerobaculales bacterium]